MSARVSRRVLAAHVAERLIKGDSMVIDELAALLAADKRQRELPLLARQIEQALVIRGVMVVTVESARPLGSADRLAIAQSLEVTPEQLRLREIVNPALIGGLKLTTPFQQLDATIAKKLTSLRTRK